MDSYKYKYISIFLIGVIFSFTFLGLVQNPMDKCKKVTLLTMEMLNPLKSMQVVNAIVKDLSFDKNSAETSKNGAPLRKNSQKQKNKNLSGFLFYFLSTILITQEKTLLILVVTFICMISKSIKTLYSGFREIITPPRLKFYIWWSLRFLTPLQKCIRSMIERYDINPILQYGARVCNAPKNLEPALCYIT
ncbi:hypothetical protein ACFLUV_01560 [Elusimicrobiota bacterium]